MNLSTCSYHKAIASFPFDMTKFRFKSNAIVCIRMAKSMQKRQRSVTMMAYFSQLQHHKSDNLQYTTLVRRDKWIVNHASDVPNIILFIISNRLRTLKTLYFYFCKSMKEIEKKLNQFLQRILKGILKNNNNTWNIRRFVDESKNSVSYCRLSDLWCWSWEK